MNEGSNWQINSDLRRGWLLPLDQPLPFRLQGNQSPLDASSPRRVLPWLDFRAKGYKQVVSKNIHPPEDIFWKYVLHFGWSEIGRVDSDDSFTITDVNRVFIYTTPFPSGDQRLEGQRYELNEGMYLSWISSALNDLFTNSRTLCVSPVANTKSSGVGC